MTQRPIQHSSNFSSSIQYIAPQYLIMTPAQPTAPAQSSIQACSDKLYKPQSTSYVQAMFDSIAPTYDLLNSLLSGGSHRAWESKLVGLLPDAPSAVCLDLCTGTGALIPKLTKRFSTVIGLDVSPRMLAIAKNRFGSLHKVSFTEGDAQDLRFMDDSFDRITVSYGIRNLPNYSRGIAEIRRVLKPGGFVGILEFGQPHSPLWRMLFNAYSASVVPVLGKLISGNGDAYAYLPKTASVFPCGKNFEKELIAQGLSPVKTIACMGGIAYIYLARKREESA